MKSWPIGCVCVLLLLLAGILRAGSMVQYVYDQTVFIHFPEPVVSPTTVWETGKEAASELFCITGDARHVPETDWVDQDTLRISFPPGSSCNTRYKLTFHEDVTYLSGAPMAKREYYFHCPLNRLTATPIATAKGCALLVTPCLHHTREAQTFSEKSAVGYVFRRVKHSFWSGKRYLGRSVAATVEPARVCDGVTQGCLARLAAAGEKVWGALESDSALPGHVLVRPVEELDFDETWVLCYAGAEGAGVVSKHQPDTNQWPQWVNEIPADGETADFHPINELYSGVSVLPAAEGTGEVEMQLYFSQPLPETVLPDLFAHLQFSIAGKGRVEQTQMGRKLTLPNKEWLLFQYSGVLPYAEHGTELSDDSECRLAYRGKGLARGMKIKVSGYLPAVVDVGVPQGTASANGAYLREKHVHRIALNPAWPQLLTHRSHTILPLKSEHKLRLPTANLSSVDVTVQRVQTHRFADVIRSLVYDSRERDKARYADLIHRERRSEGLRALENKDELKKAREEAEENLEQRAEERAAWRAGATVFPTRRYELGESALMRSSELVIDMDALAGGPLEAGLYVVTLKATPNAHVRHALALQDLRRDALSYELDIPVLVTDLNVITSQQGVLVTRFSGGSVATDVSLTECDWNTQARAYEEKPLARGKGVAFVTSEHQKMILARCGQDTAWAWLPYRYRFGGSSEQQKTAPRVFLLTDRSLYRPGDTVHIRGLVRGSKQGLACMSPLRQVKAIVYRPNGEELAQLELLLSPFGGLEMAVKLPDGEEDVTGEYELKIQFGEEEETLRIPCQVARRNAFEAVLAVEVDKVAPRNVVLRVQADDYSGVPLVGAKAELNICCEGEKTVHTMVTDAAGSATAELPMKEEWLKAGRLTVGGSICNDRAEYVRLEPQIKEFSPADFRIRYENGRIFLDDAATAAPLNCARSLDLRLMVRGMKARNPRASFTIMEPQKKEISRSELTIPAQAQRGIPIPPTLMQTLSAEEREYAELELSGRDAAGRVASCSVALDDEIGAKDEQMQLRIEPAGRQVRADFYAPHAGVVHVFVGCGERLRHLQQGVKQGEQSLDIPLQRHEEGTVSVSLVLPESGARAGSRFCAASDSCFVPVVRQHLDVELQVPAGASRPGQKVQLSGRVLANGKPAHAEVTLYAVDAGMLSLCPYEKPDPERFFAAGNELMFKPSSESPNHARVSSDMLDAVWQGDMVAGDAPGLSPHLGKKYTALTLRGRERSRFVIGPLSWRDNMLAVHEVDSWFEDANDAESVQYAPAPAPVVAAAKQGADSVALRSNFEPLAVWKGELRTDAEGRFSVDAPLPDTLTTYRVFAVAADSSGSRFGVAEAEFVVNLPVMITPGMPLFMSTGDVLKLPLSVTNATETAGTWTVSLAGSPDSQQVELPAGGSATLYFEVAPTKEGESCLQWQAAGAPGTDAVQGVCHVRFPAPLLKEVHRPELVPGQAPLKLASLLAPDVAQSTRAEAELLLSSSPMLHLRGCLDFLLSYPYACTEQRASALLPWLQYEELAPFCPQMAKIPQDKVKPLVQCEINALFARQCEDGGLGYWRAGAEGSAWASAYAAMVLTVATERGFDVPQDKLKRLLRFVKKQDDDDLDFCEARLMAARALGEQRRLLRLLDERCKHLEKVNKGKTPGVYGATMQFMRALYAHNCNGESFRHWMRTVGRDFRHPGTADSALLLLALHDYLGQQTPQQQQVFVVTEAGKQPLKREPLKLSLPQVSQPAQLPTSLAAEGGAVYALFQVKARPNQVDFPGVTEKGLQVTRLYEVKDASGQWQKAPAQLNVGDVVRITLTCAKVADELEYLVLEDYLPACMEAINPEIPTQAAGLEFVPWSPWFEHREYLADRVRGFCTRWGGRELLNMTYFARVKRAGVSTAPPAQAQLMYEPQIYGLSPNARVISRPAE